MLLNKNHSAAFLWPARKPSAGGHWRVPAVMKEKKLRIFQKWFGAENNKSSLNHCAVFVVALQRVDCHILGQDHKERLMGPICQPARMPGQRSPQ